MRRVLAHVVCFAVFSTIVIFGACWAALSLGCPDSGPDSPGNQRVFNDDTFPACPQSKAETASTRLPDGPGHEAIEFGPDGTSSSQPRR